MNAERVANDVWFLEAAPSGMVSVKTAKTLSDRRFEIAAAYHESGVIACGGRDERGFLSECTFVIPPGENPRPIRPLPQPRARHAVAVSPEGLFYVAGGVTQDEDGSLSLAGAVLVYDLTTDRWETVAQLPLRAAQLVAECVGGNLYVIAGDSGTTTEPGRPIAPARCRSDVQILDLKAGRWKRGAPKPSPETGVTSAVLGDEIFVVSSYDDLGRVHGRVEVYHCQTNTWRRIPDMPTPRTGVPCGFIGGKLYCVSGQGQDLKPISVSEVYDPRTNAWTTVAGGPEGLIGQGYACGGNRLMLLGGIL
jgi:N-acetylneuraminic acid mutarotase